MIKNWLLALVDFLMRVLKIKIPFLNIGGEINPFLAYAQHKMCLCGSAKLAKRCCLPKMSTTLPQGEARNVRELIKQAEEHPTQLGKDLAVSSLMLRWVNFARSYDASQG